MLYLANNHKLPQHFVSAERFKAKLGRQLADVCFNSVKLLAPTRSLSIDEMMVKFYGRSVINQYIQSKPHKYGVKLWAICCSCCGYSLTQILYLGGCVQSEAGRDVVLELTNIYVPTLTRDTGPIVIDSFHTSILQPIYVQKAQVCRNIRYEITTV